MHIECALTEPLDRSEDVVCRLCPAQGGRVGIVAANEFFDGLDQLFDRLVCSALDLLFCEKGKEALDLVDPRR